MAAKRTTAGDGWTLTQAGTTGAKGARRSTRAAAPTGADIPPEFLQSDAVRIDEVYEATLSPTPSTQRRAAPPELVITVPLAPGEQTVLAIRHPSGAISFHPSSERVAAPSRRSAKSATAPGVATFRIAVRATSEDGQRGVVSNTLKVVVLKIAKAAVDKAVSTALPILAARWEKRIWTQKGLREGWFHVTPTGPKTLALTSGAPPVGARSLLLLHGTFSNASSAFGDLAGTGFFDSVRPLYGDRIYAFNHFSISRTPEENARDLLAGLPSGQHLCDVITHSRGGLVLRNLIENRNLVDAGADRFRLGHAVLVASPNDGTPLGNAARWEQTVGWFASLMELFPDNPFTTGAEFISEAIVWLASHLTGDLPGLRAMDGGGEIVAELQSPPGPPADAYSALVSNFHADGALWQRAIDVGIDQFFGSANDLVVPSEGGWRTDRDGASHVPAERIGCFGPGGNLGAGTAPVHHVNYFERSETAEFLATALAGRNHKLPRIDPDRPLPDRRFTRGASRAASTDRSATELPALAAATQTPGVIAPASAPGDTDAFHIVVLPADNPDATDTPKNPRWARVLATYAGARVTQDVRLRAIEGEAPTPFGEIIRVHNDIRDFTNREGGSLPQGRELMKFGGLLFDTLFQGDVRRLYDEARSRHRRHKLDLVLTSKIPWIAEKPWEFCYDTSRKSFLATEEIHFVRNVLTAVPADSIDTCDGPLRILVASAQPVSFGTLSIDQEVSVIRRGFQSLIDAGLVSIEILPRATPEAIHDQVESGRFAIVHFIGHGEFDEQRQEGCLLFEDTRGGPYRVGERSAREIFCGRGLSLVFLNSCQSGTGGRADFNKGVAQSMVAHGLPALVANQYSVSDSSATSFAQYFYASLAQGRSLGHAAREARIAVNYSLDGDVIDWAVPVLYARDANQSLCPRRAAANVATAIASPSGQRRTVRSRRRRRIAVWDVDMVFPALEKTVARMNAAQTVLGFELVDLTAPLDAWDFSNDRAYLHAEHVAKRLRSKPGELHVDLLACITSHWMRDNETLNIYAWWPDEASDPPIGIFSTAGLGLAPEGPETDRAIVNTMVTLLAGFFGDQDSHEKGAKTCPLYYDATRDRSLIIGEQKFDANCRKKLEKHIPEELPALDALLKFG